MRRKLKTDMKTKSNKIKFFDTRETAGVKGPVTHICGDRQASVDGCLGVIDYYENIIRLRVQSGTVTFCGTGLCMEELTDTLAEISGKIASVAFETEGGACL